MEEFLFQNRDLSWLGFNRRILQEAADASVPLLERIRFLSIYSSNLDEFYRVRVPVLMALQQVNRGEERIYESVKEEVKLQQDAYGAILQQQILPALAAEGVCWIYNRPIPGALDEQVAAIFFNEVLTFLRPQRIDDRQLFFAANNVLYQAVVLLNEDHEERIEFVNIPTDVLPRFFTIRQEKTQYILFLDDVMKSHLKYLYPNDTLKGVYHVKITRDASLRLEEEVGDDMVLMMEAQLKGRDLNSATRFLYEPGIPLRHLYQMIYALKLEHATLVEGGVYHNLKDLSRFPLHGKPYNYPLKATIPAVILSPHQRLLHHLQTQDVLVHTPYHSYGIVLRFFNEAAHDAGVEAIYCSLYRVAEGSKIVQALITAARNGKKVSVMLELKARFDEANNIKWAREMKEAGIKIYYSSISFKVHAKVALIRRKAGDGPPLQGLFATGNFNEVTSRFYTDHVLLTGRQKMLLELESLFVFLSKKKMKPAQADFINFEELLVSQFNMQQKFIDLIDFEIQEAGAGRSAGIQLKLNNLEEQVLITKLYEASQAGVKIQLLVRGICSLVPGIDGQSSNISVKRIVGRYLEHGRIFVFHHGGLQQVFMGSADWMNRNIYNRIEVCFPVHEQAFKAQLLKLMDLQLSDEQDPQEAIYHYLSQE